MTGRPLDADEAALWARVLATVRPLPGRTPPAPGAARALAPTVAPLTPTISRPPSATPAAKALTAPRPGATLDGSWDRKLARGLVMPDSVLDLHGHTLHTAYERLDGALEQAVAGGDRVVLLITGKPPRPDADRPHARGLIRDAVGDWLAGSRHARSIAAVRGAHPRHGGGGALYIILRRQRSPRPPES